MEKSWKKILAYGCGLILILSAVATAVGYASYGGIDPKFLLKSLIVSGAVLAGFAVVCLVQLSITSHGKTNMINEFVEVFTRYRFLLNQLVGKEFKLKYRRSYLGVAWSLINPLLMMIVVSAVFSFVFKFNVECFPAYLILGQCFFTLFSEATQNSLSSIVTSGQLVKKVYVPKCIFPLSRIISAFINFAITLIPVAGVLVFYGKFPGITLVYLPIILIYFCIFNFGIGLILSTAEVFMRDVQHLYGVLLLALNYATPIFYPIDALSPTMQKVLQFNPLYHYLKYFRDILFYHTCPTVRQNVICLGLSLIMLAIGMVCFFKKQKKFILYI